MAQVYFFLEESVSYENALMPANFKSCHQDLMKTLYIEFQTWAAFEKKILYQKCSFMA